MLCNGLGLGSQVQIEDVPASLTMNLKGRICLLMLLTPLLYRENVGRYRYRPQMTLV